MLSRPQAAAGSAALALAQDPALEVTLALSGVGLAILVGLWFRRRDR